MGSNGVDKISAPATALSTIIFFLVLQGVKSNNPFSSHVRDDTGARVSRQSSTKSATCEPIKVAHCVGIGYDYTRLERAFLTMGELGRK